MVLPAVEIVAKLTVEDNFDFSWNGQSSIGVGSLADKDFEEIFPRQGFIDHLVDNESSPTDLVGRIKQSTSMPPGHFGQRIACNSDKTDLVLQR